MLFPIRKGLSSRPGARARSLLLVGIGASVLLGSGLGAGDRTGDRTCEQTCERTIVGGGESLDPIISIARLPASIDAVVVVEDAASIRVSDAGEAAIAALVETGSLSRTTQSWEELASSLGWSSTEAFDELLGRRVVLVLDEIEGKDGSKKDGPRWVLLADVDESTTARLRKKLKLTPRTIANNARVLAGERGRFRLAVIAGQQGSGVSSLLIAPVEHKSFFFQTLSAMTAQRAVSTRFGDTLGYRQLKKLERRPIRMVVQPTTDAGVSQTFFAMAAECDRGDWAMHWSSSPDVLGLVSDAVGEDHPWPRRAFDRLSQGSLVSVMSVTGRMKSDALGPLGHVATGLLNVGGAAKVLAAAGSVQMIAIHRTEPTVPVGVGSPDARSKRSAQIGLTIAAQSAAPGDAAAIDGALAAFIAHVTASPDADRLDLKGSFPGATRSVTINPGERSELAWFHAPDQDVTIRWAQNAAAGQGQGGDEGGGGGDGWWAVQITGRDERSQAPDRVREVIGLLAGGGGGGGAGRGAGGASAANRISMGVIKPRDLIDWLTDLGMDATGELAVFRDIERFGWEAWLTPERTVEGEMRLTLRPRIWIER